MKRREFLKELEESKKQNFEDNLRFVTLYVKWLKSKSNAEWSREQKRFIDEVYKGVPKKGKDFFK